MADAERCICCGDIIPDGRIACPHCLVCVNLPEEDEEEEEENDYDLDAYFDWVKEHDHEFAAERVGLDLDACRDDEVNYTITIE